MGCVEYTLELLLGKDFGEHQQGAKILYQQPEVDTSAEAVLHIVPSGFFGRHYGKPGSLPSLPLKEIEGVPLLYGSPNIKREGKRLVVYADIIASTYFMVTRYEEMVRRDVRDEHGRFPGRESLPYRAGFIDRPIVEEYAILLRKWLREMGINLPEPRRKFSVLVTHDVDALIKYKHAFSPLRVLISVLLGRQPMRNVRESLTVASGFERDPFDNFKELITLDATLNRDHATIYFFMACGKKESRNRYDIRSRKARETIKLVCGSGAQIGLHTSYEAGIFPELIAEEKARLEEVCGFPIRHNRHHYLAWREIEDGWALAKARIDWDSTLGYADLAGFRLGVCHPIALFDPIKLEPFGIEEHPLIVMDCSLSHPGYMGLKEEEVLVQCEDLINQTRKHNGEFVMLWHNQMFTQEPKNCHAAFYRRLIAELSGPTVEKKDAFGA